MRFGVVGLAGILVLGIVGCDQTPTAQPSGVPPASQGALPSGPGGSGAPTTGPQASGQPSGAASNPTSADLIQADVSAGVIDRATGLLYRVYAVFGDPRLPAEYASDVIAEDGAALATARFELDSLPPAIAEELRPFLVRPTDPSSVFHDVRQAASAGAQLASIRSPAWSGSRLAAPAAVTCNPISGWGYGLGVSNFKVWGECGTPADDADIQQVVSMVEGFWDAESTFLSREPLADDGTPDPDEWLNDAGGDPRIDVYLVNACISRGGTCRAMGATSLGETLADDPYTTVKGVGVWSSYVLLPKGLLSQVPLFRATTAHELFHVFQNSMNLEGRLDRSDNTYHWITEASAKWAEWHFSQVDENVIPWFNTFQGTDHSLQDRDGGNPYSSFTWPLFMEEEAGDPSVIATLWQALEGQGTLDAVQMTIDRQRPFKDNFRNFAIRNWNKELGVGDPMDPLHPVPPTLRGEPYGDHAWAETQLPANLPGNPFTFHEYVRSLYAKYAPFKVDDDVGQIVLDLGTLPNRERFKADALVKVKGQGWEHRKLKKGKTTWCTDNPDDDIEEFVVIISNHDIDNFSVQGDWTAESLLEPCLSYEIAIEWTDVYDGIADPFNFRGWADHLDPDMSGNGVITLTGMGTIEGSRPGWKACNPGIDIVPSGNGPALFVASIAGEQLSISAFPDLAATEFGVSTEPFTMERKGGTLTIKSEGTIGTLCPRSWRGTITATLKLKEPLGNAEGD